MDDKETDCGLYLNYDLQNYTKHILKDITYDPATESELIS